MENEISDRRDDICDLYIFVCSIYIASDMNGVHSVKTSSLHCVEYVKHIKTAIFNSGEHLA